MRKHLILFFLLYSISVFSQSDFFFNGSIQYPAKYSHEFDRNSTVSELKMINDTTYLRRTYTSNVKHMNDVIGRLGFNLGINYKLELSEKLDLVGGIRVHYTRYELKTQFSSERGELLAIDTVKLFNGTGQLCDKYTNSISDLDYDRDEGNIFTNINLMIPVEFRYAIYKDIIKVGLGGYLRTPIYSRESYERIGLNQTDESGMNCCTFTVEEVEIINDSDLNYLQIGLMANIVFKLADKINLKLEAQKNLDNAYRNTESDLYFENNFVYKPLTLGLGLEYRL